MLGIPSDGLQLCSSEAGTSTRWPRHVSGGLLVLTSSDPSSIKSTSKYPTNPRLVLATRILSLIRLAYPSFKPEIESALGRETKSRFEKAHLANLRDLCEWFIPKVCYLLVFLLFGRELPTTVPWDEVLTEFCLFVMSNQYIVLVEMFLTTS